jgi:hypothetical protein
MTDEDTIECKLEYADLHVVTAVLLDVFVPYSLRYQFKSGDPAPSKVKAEFIRSIEPRMLTKDYYYLRDTSYYLTLIDDKEQEDILLKYARENIDSSCHYVFEPMLVTAHGGLRFRKHLRFDGWTEDRKQELIDKLIDAPIKICEKNGDFITEAEVNWRLKFHSWTYTRRKE